MAIRDCFGGAADREATWQREARPDPAKLRERGITTRETLDWQATRAAKDPAPELHIDDPALRREALEATEAAHHATVKRLREAFQSRSEKARQDFDTAHGRRNVRRIRSAAAEDHAKMEKI